MLFPKCLLTVKMINEVRTALGRPDFRLEDSQALNLRLFPSFLNGLPATESIKSDTKAPVLRLIYDRNNGSNWPPLVSMNSLRQIHMGFVEHFILGFVRTYASNGNIFII